MLSIFKKKKAFFLLNSQQLPEQLPGRNRHLSESKSQPISPRRATSPRRGLGQPPPSAIVQQLVHLAKGEGSRCHRGLWCSSAALNFALAHLASGARAQHWICRAWIVCFFKRARSLECRQKNTCHVRARQLCEHEYATQSAKPRLSLRAKSQKNTQGANCSLQFPESVSTSDQAHAK